MGCPPSVTPITVPNGCDIVGGGNSFPPSFCQRFPHVCFDSVLGSEIKERFRCNLPCQMLFRKYVRDVQFPGEPLQQDGTTLLRSGRSSEVMNVKGRMRRMGTRSNGIVDSGPLDLPISPIAFFFYRVRSIWPYLGSHLSGSNDEVNIRTTREMFHTTDHHKGIHTRGLNNL